MPIKNGKTKAQTCNTNCPRSLSSRVAEPRFKSRPDSTANPLSSALYCVTAGYLKLRGLAFGARRLFVMRTVLYVVACLAAPLNSTRRQ